MLQPKRTKYRKQQKGKIKGIAYRGSQLAFGSFAIKTLDEDKWQSTTKHPVVLSISTALREIAENLLSQTKVVRHYFLLRAVRSEIFRLGF